jgi:hypothetical protein
MNMNSFIVLHDYISLIILHILIMAFFNMLEYNVQQINIKRSSTDCIFLSSFI